MINSKEYNFTEIDSDTSFTNLANVLDAKYIDGNIRLTTPFGKGSIAKVKIEEGLITRAWDLDPAQSILFRKNAAEPTGENVFHIIYLLNPQSLQADNIKLGSDIIIHEGMNVLFISGNTDLAFEVTPGNRLKAIDISISSSWLMSAYQEAGSQTNSFITQLDESNQPIVFMDSCSFEQFKTLAGLHGNLINRPNGMLHNKAAVLSLVSEFFDRMFSHQPHELLGSRVFHYHRMIEVEKILTAHLQKKLPSLEAIAQEVTLSVSTLKRHFKLMYGKSIYEYYLDLKMNLAKHMLQEKPLTINEVAAMLDYEKVSSFIEMFKKHHGFSPGNIRKNGILR